MLPSAQYNFVTDARSVLLDYCGTISANDFTRPSGNFGKGGSIRNLLVHIGNTYHGWLGPFVPEKSVPEKKHADVEHVGGCRQYFAQTDELVLSFLKKYEENLLQPLQIGQNGVHVIHTPLKLFTHVITHEFHHKGQILSLSRLWGYVPVDTDILR